MLDLKLIIIEICSVIDLFELQLYTICHYLVFIGDAEGGFMPKENGQDGQEGPEGQEQSYKGNEESNDNYSQGNEGMQSSVRPEEGGSIASVLSDPSSQANQDTQSIISEGQKITSSDAAQLAEAIENANKGNTRN